MLKSDAIFLQAPGLNKMILIGENKSLSSFKKKILNIPYNCSRANFSTLMEIYQRLTNAHLEINDERINKLF